jgi:ubiquinone/menaquinone biosynthesis C-methylase UbiE
MAHTMTGAVPARYVGLDVRVISFHGVINLSADKDQVLREDVRVLRPGRRFASAFIPAVTPGPGESR